MMHSQTLVLVRSLIACLAEHAVMSLATGGTEGGRRVRSVNDFGAFSFEAFEAVPHVLQLLGRVPLPVCHLSHCTKRMAGAQTIDV